MLEVSKWLYYKLFWEDYDLDINKIEIWLFKPTDSCPLTTGSKYLNTQDLIRDQCRTLIFDTFENYASFIFVLLDLRVHSKYSINFEGRGVKRIS